MNKTNVIQPIQREMIHITDRLTLKVANPVSCMKCILKSYIESFISKISQDKVLT